MLTNLHKNIIKEFCFTVSMLNLKKLKEQESKDWVWVTLSPHFLWALYLNFLYSQITIAVFITLVSSQYYMVPE